MQTLQGGRHGGLVFVLGGGVLLLALTPGCWLCNDEPETYPNRVEVHNQSTHTIARVYVSPSSSAYWGNNQINSTIPPGGVHAISSVPNDRYDLLAEDTTGQWYWETYGVDLYDGSTLTWNLLGGSDAPAGTGAAWTFMVYLCGDNNLEDAGILDFLELASVGSTSQVNIVVMMDRCPGYDTSYDNWTDTRRGRVDRGDVPSASWGEGMGEINMGLPESLSSFVVWSAQTFPANHYALVLWDHGSGWDKRLAPGAKAVCFDDSSGNNALHMEELEAALQTAVAALGRPIDLIGFDACLMGMAEVAYQIRNYGEVMIGSEELEPAYGWPYHLVLETLTAEPSISARNIGKCIVNSYYSSYDYTEILSAIDLTLMDGVAGAVRTFGRALRSDWNRNTSVCVSAANGVINAVDAAVIHERHGSQWQYAHGMAVYFPYVFNRYDPGYDNPEYIRFPTDTEWNLFLREYYGGMSTSWVGGVSDEVQSFGPDGDHVDLYDLADLVRVRAPGKREPAPEPATANHVRDSRAHRP